MYYGKRILTSPTHRDISQKWKWGTDGRDAPQSTTTSKYCVTDSSVVVDHFQLRPIDILKSATFPDAQWSVGLYSLSPRLRGRASDNKFYRRSHLVERPTCLATAVWIFTRFAFSGCLFRQPKYSKDKISPWVDTYIWRRRPSDTRAIYSLRDKSIDKDLAAERGMVNAMFEESLAPGISGSFNPRYSIASSVIWQSS